MVASPRQQAPVERSSRTDEKGTGGAVASWCTVPAYNPFAVSATPAGEVDGGLGEARRRGLSEPEKVRVSEYRLNELNVRVIPCEAWKHARHYR
jgi:hypothetical protein